MTSKIFNKLKETGDTDFESQVQELLKEQEQKDKNEEEKKDFTIFEKDNALFDSNSSLNAPKKRKMSNSGKKVSIHKPLYKTPSKSYIHIGHDNWNLVLHMMLGARQSVMNVMHEEVFDLLD